MDRAENVRRPAASFGFDRAILIGIGFMLLTTALFPVMNGMVKLLNAGYDPMQIVWARTLGHTIFMLMLFAPKRGLAIFRTTRPGAQFGRSMLLLTSTACFFFAVKYVPLATAAAIGFIAPLIVNLLAVPMLGEKLSAGRIAAVAVGLAGVLIVIRPGSDVFHWASLFIVASSSCYALYQVYTRQVAGHDAPETSVVYSALLGTIVMTFVLPWVWRTPASWQDIAILSSLGVFGGLGHYFVAKAMTYGAANIMSAFNYFQMIGSVIVGYVMFGEMPDWMTWAGTAIIVGCGLYVAWNGSRVKKAA